MATPQTTFWTEEQVNYLLESYGEVTMMTMMRELGKSHTAIIQKLQHLHNTRSIEELSGNFTISQLADILGVDRRTIHDWIDKRNFPAKRLHKKGGQTKKLRFYVNPDNVWKWAEQNRECIPYVHVKRGILLPEPDWFLEELKAAKPHKRPTSWTAEEDRQALNWDSQGLHYTEIAERLRRPAQGTWRRISVLRKKQLKAFEQKRMEEKV